MFRTGIDASCLEKEYTPLESFNQKTEASIPTGELTPIEKPIPTKIVTKALLGASVTTQDQDFDKKYQEAMRETLHKHGIHQKKQIYKGAHLIKQIKGKYEDVFTDILNAMEPSIEHIDLYHATYLHKNPTEDYVSIFGKAQGQRLTPLEYVEKNKNGFDQACTWWNWVLYSKQEPEHQYYIDHFNSKVTTGWKELENSNVDMKVLYSGCECNCLVSLADLILKEVETFHFGAIDYLSILEPIRNKIRDYGLRKNRIKSYNLSKTDIVIRRTVPEVPLDIDLTPYLKHPIYFIAWTPAKDVPRKTVRPTFEWSKFYNSVMDKALKNDGCVKFLDFDGDQIFWQNNDFIVPWETPDLEHVRQLQSMGFDQMPKILNATDLTT